MSHWSWVTVLISVAAATCGLIAMASPAMRGPNQAVGKALDLLTIALPGRPNCRHTLAWMPVELKEGGSWIRRK